MALRTPIPFSIPDPHKLRIEDSGRSAIGLVAFGVSRPTAHWHSGYCTVLYRDKYQISVPGDLILPIITVQRPSIWGPLWAYCLLLAVQNGCITPPRRAHWHVRVQRRIFPLCFRSTSTEEPKQRLVAAPLGIGVTFCFSPTFRMLRNVNMRKVRDACCFSWCLFPGKG